MPRFACAFLALAVASAAAAPPFELSDTRGNRHNSSEWQGHKAIVLFFVTTDCPVGNSYVPEMNRIRDSYAPQDVIFFAVQAETSVTPAEVAQYAAEYHYRFPLLIDSKQVLVRLTGATITPQAAVLTGDSKLLYLGRIDNRVEDFGQQRLRATHADLREALDAVLAGKPIPHPFTKSIGCAINRVAEGKP